MGFLALCIGAGLLTCASVALGVTVLVGHLYLSSGRGGFPVLLPPVVFVFSSVTVTAVSFLVLWFCIAKCSRRSSILSGTGTAIVALAFGLCSPLLGKAPYQNFLDGFAARVSAVIVERDAVAWADEVFADRRVAEASDSVIRLQQSRIPAFFSALFPGGEPSAVVSYSKAGDPLCVHVFVGGGFAKWGIAIFATNSTPTNDAMDYRRCGHRMFAFHSNR